MGVGENVSKAVNTPVVTTPTGESVSKAGNAVAVCPPIGAAVSKAVNTVVLSHGSPLHPLGMLSVSKAVNTVVLEHAAPPPPPTSGSALLIWDSTYQRWRNQSFPATTLFYEPDTNLLLFATPEAGAAGNGYAIRYLAYQDYDDGGWVPGIPSTILHKAIPVTIQIPYQDLGKPHFPKQWNMVEIDVNTQGQFLNITLLFDDTIAPITLATVNTGSERQKVQLAINNGDGQQSYKMSVVLTIAVGATIAPIFYQMNLYAAVLAAARSTFDTYWIKMQTDESKLVKEGYFDYTSTAPITVSLYADGSTTPYYTFTLPTNAARASVPMRVRFPAVKCRMWRLVAVSNGTTPDNAFQLWTAPAILWKPADSGSSGYARMELTT